MRVQPLLACALLFGPGVALADARFAADCRLVESRLSCRVTNLGDEPAAACVRSVVTISPPNDRSHPETRKAHVCTRDLAPGGAVQAEAKFHDSKGDVARCAHGQIACSWTREVSEDAGLHVAMRRSLHRYGAWWAGAGVMSLIGYGAWRVGRRRRV